MFTKGKLQINKLFLLFIAIIFIPIFHYAQSPDWEWIESAEGSAVARSVSIDSFGNAYVIGSFVDSITVGSSTYYGLSDIFLIKYDPNGDVLWVRTPGGSSLDLGQEVVVDAFDNIYISGEFCSHTIDFGEFTVTNNYINPNPGLTSFDMYIAKLDPDGNYLWAKSGGGLHHEFVNKIDSDQDGNVYVFGHFLSPEVSFDDHTLINSGNIDVFLIKYSSDSTVEWARNIIGDNQENAWTVVVDNDNNVYISGSYNGSSIAFDDVTFTNTSDDFDLYLFKLDPFGSVLLGKSAKGQEWDDADCLTVDAENNIYMCGQFGSDSLEFDTTTLYLSSSTSVNIDMYILKMDSNGNIVWSTSSEGGAWIYPHSLCAFSDKRIAITGSFNGLSNGFSGNLGTTVIDPVGSYDIFLNSFDTDGNACWSEVFGGNDMEFGQDVEFNTNGNLYLAAYFSSNSMTIGDVTLINNFVNKMFLAKMAPDNASVIPQEIDYENDIALFCNPNPLNTGTMISFSSSDMRGISEIEIYNIIGQCIKILHVKDYSPGTLCFVYWDGTDENKRPIGSGIYLYRLKADNLSRTNKMVVIK